MLQHLEYKIKISNNHLVSVNQEFNKIIINLILLNKQIKHNILDLKKKYIFNNIYINY